MQCDSDVSDIIPNFWTADFYAHFDTEWLLDARK